MKSLVALIAAACVAGLVTPSQALAQRAAHGRGGLYNPQTVETVSGEVIAVERVAYGRRGSYGIHMLLKTRSGKLTVHLGPSRFMDRQSLKVEPRDVIEVTGSKVTYRGRPALIAAEIKKGAEALTLRDARGIPLWSRSRYR